VSDDVRQVIERLGADLASALRHERELADDRDDWKRRAEVAEAEIKALKSDLERARYAPLGDNHHNAAACPHCRPKLTAQPAPSGWQPIESAPKDGTPVLGTGGTEIPCVMRCFGASWSTIPAGYSVHPRRWMPLPPGPGQNAVDALPPAPEVKDAIPPVPEGATAKEGD
jgi:hypothetical protein